ncbi:MAG: PQQ-dependent sugar dehydrogenase [Myxococcales bacterium]|nr:PQQ-dependent sugar dehydrogenase [Myxococcales bacterium]
MNRLPLLVALGAVACGSPVAAPDDAGPSTSMDAGPLGGGSAVDAGLPRSTVTPIITREPVLTIPSGVIWDLAFLPDGSALFTVRSGQVRRLVLGETSSTLVADRMSVGAPLGGLFAEGQSGLMGLAVDPAFTTNRRVYLYFSHDAGGTKDNRVVRYRLTDDFRLEDRQDLVTGISYKAVATRDGAVGSHSGGRLRFGPDGFLYLTTGDNHSPVIPQSLEALGSKVLRFTTDGQPAPGNPMLGSRNLIWALGFRNPQGITFHPVTGSVFISEHGPNADDEVTKLTAGANGGWNPVSGTGAYNGYTGARMTDTASVPGAVAPVWKADDSQGMSACTFLSGRSWLAWENRLAVGFLAGQRINVLDLDEPLERVLETGTMPGVNVRVRSLVIGPDEKLYVTSDSGSIFRYAPSRP